MDKSDLKKGLTELLATSVLFLSGSYTTNVYAAGDYSEISRIYNSGVAVEKPFQPPVVFVPIPVQPPQPIPLPSQNICGR